MKLSKDLLVKLAYITDVDSQQRKDEWDNYRTTEPDPKNYDFEKTKEVFPEGEYFDIQNVEGFTGMFEGKFLIYFRGTDSILDWVRNLTFNLISFKVTPYKEKGVNRKIKVHNGFYKSYRTVRDFLHKKVMESDAKEILVHGMSKGAALTTLCALDIQYNFPEKEVGIFPTASPRVGNKHFVESFNRRLPDCPSVEYASDIITLLPPRIFGYQHVGVRYHVGPERKWWKTSKKWHNWTEYRQFIESDLEDRLYP